MHSISLSYTLTCTYKHTSTHTILHTLILAYTQEYAHMHIQMYSYNLTCMHIHKTQSFTHIYTCICTNAQVNMPYTKAYGVNS